MTFSIPPALLELAVASPDTSPLSVVSCKALHGVPPFAACDSLHVRALGVRGLLGDAAARARGVEPVVGRALPEAAEAGDRENEPLGVDADGAPVEGDASAALTAVIAAEAAEEAAGRFCRFMWLESA